MPTVAMDRHPLQGQFGARLVRLRENKHITQRALAEMVGVSPQYLYKVEYGQRRDIGIELLTRLCNALDLSADTLLGLDHVVS